MTWYGETRAQCMAGQTTRQRDDGLLVRSNVTLHPSATGCRHGNRDESASLVAGEARLLPMLLFHVTVGEERGFTGVDLFASDIPTALAEAYDIAAGRSFELWEGGRKICAIHPAETPPKRGSRRQNSKSNSAA